MNKEKALEWKKQILRAGALMRQADFCERGVDSEVISFMIEASFTEIADRLCWEGKVPPIKTKNVPKERKPVSLGQVLEFKKKEI